MFESNSILRNGCATLISIALWSNVLLAMPVDESVAPLAEEFNLPPELQEIRLLKDNEQRVIYVQPRGGRLALAKNQQPSFSFVEYKLGDKSTAILNMEVDFSLPANDFTTIKEAVARKGYVLRYLPWFEATANMILPASSEALCEFSDNHRGTTTKICKNIVSSYQIKKFGPTLGERIALTIALDETGTALIPKLMRTINGLQVGLELSYKVFTGYAETKVIVDYQRMADSFELIREQTGKDGLNEIELTNFVKNIADCHFMQFSSECFNYHGIVQGGSELTLSVKPAIEAALLKRVKQELLVPVADELEINWLPSSSAYPKFYFNEYESTPVQISKKSVPITDERQSYISAIVGCLEIDEQTSDVVKREDGVCDGYW
ncbi:MAG: hypothetical protein KBD78_08980 [Oligoflexales bacterium]|nr:hypothetical protein [Oligoflexales bacterium]